MKRRPLVADPHAALVAGIGAYLLGTLLLWDAYEHRGADRPFWLRFLPGA